MQTVDDLRRALADAEKRELIEALNTAQGSVAGAAGLLGVTRQTVHRRIKKYGVRLTIEVRAA